MKSKPTQNKPAQSDQRMRRVQKLSRLATLTIAGKVIFLASAWLLPIASEYSLVGDNISELVLGRYGFIQIAAFLISGLSTLGLVFVLQHFVVPSRGTLIGSLLIAIYGAGAILAAIFPTDRIDSPTDLASLSATGTIHIAVASISFLSILVGMFVLTWTLRRQTQRPLLLGLVLLSGSALSLFFAQTQGPLAGLMQRLLVTVVSIWLILVAVRVLAIAASEGD